MTHVLLVEDEPGIAGLLALKLERLGHRVTIEGDGTAGLETAQRLRPDVVLLDWVVPGLEGPEVCRRLREDPDPGLAATPVLMVTGRGRAADVERGLAAGADDYVVKPFSPRDLSRRVDAVLAAARTNDPAPPTEEDGRG